MVYLEQLMTEYRGAVLIIGSLWWDTLEIRNTWRIDRLKENVQKVYAPIRYGKSSKTWGYTYTMVFSQLCYRKGYGLGTAILVPFKKSINSAGDLIKEAAELWKAEKKARENRSLEVSLGWGAVGLKVKPGLEISDKIVQGWVKHYREQTVTFQQAQLKTEKAIIDDDGFLQIRWLNIVEKNTPVEFDFVLATATQPTLENGKYPSARLIAHAWCNDNQDNVRYFRNNLAKGITTFQDGTISRFMETNGE